MTLRLLLATIITATLVVYGGCAPEDDGPLPYIPPTEDVVEEDTATPVEDTAVPVEDVGEVCANDDDCAGIELTPCQIARCEAGGCITVALENGVQCDDGSSCSLDETCQDGECKGTPVECNDGNLCTTDECDEEVGCVSTNNTDPCDDGKICTEEDTCTDGICKGTSKDCNDDDVCTTDECDAEGNCQQSFNQAPCDDGEVCTGNDKCDNGQCVGVPQVCDDGNPCTIDSCNTDNGNCKIEHLNEGDCDDGSLCTTNSVCINGDCVGETIECDDGNTCTADGCDGETGCEYTVISGACNDGDPCTLNDTCTEDVCDGEPVDCDDNNPCTEDFCVPGSGCGHTADSGAACDDADACTTEDICESGQCTGNAVVCTDGDPCTDDNCLKVTGCSFPNNSAQCDDGDACTVWDFCSNGTCEGQPITCDDENPCTDDLCDPDTGCTTVNNAIECDDGDSCTEADACGGGSCSGTTVDCDDGNVCTADTCLTSFGCQYLNVAGSCDDGFVCTEGDLCSGGVCSGTAIPDCVPPNCGDGICSIFESCEDCSQDCPCCGDGICNEDETCATCTEDCGECPPLLCEETDLIYDTCGGPCDPTINPNADSGFCVGLECTEPDDEGTCLGNTLCVPTIDGVNNPKPFYMSNGACVKECSADFQCGSDICIPANGLTAVGFCAHSCIPGLEGYCQEDETCVPELSSQLGGACLPGGECDPEDPNACSGDATACVTLYIGATTGVCLNGCFLEDDNACADLPETECFLRAGDEWTQGTCAGQSEDCDPVAQTGCGTGETCTLHGGMGYGGIAHICVAATGSANVTEACASHADCQAGLGCHDGACASYCSEDANNCSGANSCNDISIEYGLPADTIGFCLPL